MKRMQFKNVKINAAFIQDGISFIKHSAEVAYWRTVSFKIDSESWVLATDHSLI